MCESHRKLEGPPVDLPPSLPRRSRPDKAAIPAASTARPPVAEALKPAQPAHRPLSPARPVSEPPRRRSSPSHRPQVSPAAPTTASTARPAAPVRPEPVVEKKADVLAAAYKAVADLPLTQALDEVGTKLRALLLELQKQEAGLPPERIVGVKSAARARFERGGIAALYQESGLGAKGLPENPAVFSQRREEIVARVREQIQAHMSREIFARVSPEFLKGK